MTLSHVSVRINYYDCIQSHKVTHWLCCNSYYTIAEYTSVLRCNSVGLPLWSRLFTHLGRVCSTRLHETMDKGGKLKGLETNCLGYTDIGVYPCCPLMMFTANILIRVFTITTVPKFVFYGPYIMSHLSCLQINFDMC